MDNRFYHNKCFRRMCGIGILFLISILFEIFIFNYSYFTMNNNEKGIEKINEENLFLSDIKIKDNEFVITGDNPYFKVKKNKYINCLKIELDQQSNAFACYTKMKKIIPLKEYNCDANAKKNSFIMVKEKAKNVEFHIKKVNGNRPIKIKNIFIDNTFTFNKIRCLAIFAVLVLSAYLILFKKIAKKKLHVTFFMIVISLGTVISIANPTYISWDEKAHFIKAYKIAQFDLGFINDKKDNWVINIDDFFASINNKGLDSYKEKVEYVNQFTSKNYTKKANYTSTAQTYLFIPYIPYSIGIFVGKLMELPFIYIFYLGRIFSLVSYAIIGSLIIKYIKIAKRLVFMIALLPTLVFIAGGGYSTDPITFMFAMATVSVFINMLASKEHSLDYRMVFLFIGFLSITIMSKVTYAPLGILLLVISSRKFKNKNKANKYKIIGACIAILAMIITLWFSSTKNINQWSRSGVDIKDQVQFIMNNIPRYVYIMCICVSKCILVYFQGSSTILACSGTLPNVCFIIMMISLFVVAIIDNETETLKLRRIDKIALISSIILVWILVLTALYITFNAVGSYYIDGVQGRYFAPLLLPLFLIFKNNKVISNFKKENLNYIISWGATFFLFITVVKLILQYNS